LTIRDVALGSMNRNWPAGGSFAYIHIQQTSSLQSNQEESHRRTKVSLRGTRRAQGMTEQSHRCDRECQSPAGCISTDHVYSVVTDHNHVDTPYSCIVHHCLDVLWGIDQHRSVRAVLCEDGELRRVGQGEWEGLGVDNVPEGYLSASRRTARTVIVLTSRRRSAST